MLSHSCLLHGTGIIYGSCALHLSYSSFMSVSEIWGNLLMDAYVVVQQLLVRFDCRPQLHRISAGSLMTSQHCRWSVTRSKKVIMHNVKIHLCKSLERCSRWRAVYYDCCSELQSARRALVHQQAHTEKNNMPAVVPWYLRAPLPILMLQLQPHVVHDYLPCLFLQLCWIQTL